jgi:hypothetical protein
MVANDKQLIWFEILCKFINIIFKKKNILCETFIKLFINIILID